MVLKEVIDISRDLVEVGGGLMNIFFRHVKVSGEDHILVISVNKGLVVKQP